MKITFSKKLVFSLLTILVIAASISAPLASGSEMLSFDAQNTTQTTTPKGYVVARIYFENEFELNFFTNQLDVWETHTDDAFVVARISPDDYLRLTQSGYRVEIDPEKTSRLAPEAVLDPRFYYFDDYVNNPNGLYVVDLLEQTTADFANIAELFDAGDAWQASHGGYHRDIWVIRITNEDPAYGAIADKPAFFLFASIHAREVATSELAIRYLKYLTTGFNGEGGYGIDPDVTWLVNHNVAYILVMQNPDGRVVNELNTSAYRRKNMDSDDGCGSSSDWGVDLNRNHSFFWGCCGGSSGAPCDDTYRGPSRGSEPETQAFQDFFTQVMDDQNGPNGVTQVPPAAPDDANGIFISLHSYSDLVMAPWDLPQPNPNANQLGVIQRKLASINGYLAEGIGYTVDGPTDDWTYGMFGIASFTYEVGPSGGSCGDFFPAYGCIDGIDGMPRNFWAENKPSFIYAHKIARTPYMTSYGPDTENVVLTPAVIQPGESVQITADVLDQRYAGDPLTPINAAEYFIGEPGEDGTGIAMNPADGSWGETSETITATLDTTGLANGAYYVLVHGRNSNGDWGPFTAQWLYIMEPGVAPIIAGYVRDAVTNQPIEATVSAGNFQTQTDPETGYYSMAVISGTYNLSASAANHLPGSVSGVQTFDYQTTRQNIYLDSSATCPIFNDTIENGNQGWTAQSPWAITTESSHSATHSWTDSPGGSYTNNRNISLTSQVFDLSQYSNITVNFWHQYNTELNYDYGYVEYSTNGTNWLTAASFHGVNTTWHEETVSLSGLAGSSTARLRFRFTSDVSVTADGWHVDDITLSGGGLGCQPPIEPSAAFTHTAATVGSPVAFTDQTYGSQPMDYLWTFGDGAGSSNESDPAYIFTAPGVYTVTLAVTNSAGSDAISHSVIVSDVVCQDVTGVSLSQNTPGVPAPGQSVSFDADIAPDWATTPYSFTIDFGDGVTSALSLTSDDPFTFDHTYAITGLFPLEIAVWNCAMAAPVTDTLPVEVAIPACEDLTSVTLQLISTGTLYTGSEVLFSADFAPDTASKPIEITVDFGDGVSTTTSTSADPLEIAHVYASGGVFQAQISASNCAMSLPVEDSIAVTISDEETFSFELFAPVTETVRLPGQPAEYTLWLTNTSTTSETFAITFDSLWPASVSGPGGWLISGDIVELASGDDLPFTVVVTPTLQTADGDTDFVNLIVDGAHTPAQSLTLTTVVHVLRIFLPFLFK